MMRPDFDSPYYPYYKEVPGATTMKGSEDIPYKLLLYLIDLPDAYGYEPKDDNTRARVRLAKYLWYDNPYPLEQVLPSPEQKLSLLFDPDMPDITSREGKEKHPKGYRMLWQKVIGQSETEASVTLKCYIGRVFENKPFVNTIGIRFEIFANTDLDTNTGTSAYQRVFNIEQCLREALNGVNIAGVGTVSFYRYDHTDNESLYGYDDKTNVGRIVHCSVKWAEGGSETLTSY